METIKSYKDLCTEIEIWKERVKAYEAEIKALKKLAKAYGPSDISAIDYSQPKVQGTKQIGFEEFLERLQKLEKHIYIHLEAIENMERSRRRMEERIKQLKGIDQRVVYLRDIEGKTLKEIADELGYSEIYIKKISARNKRVY